MNAVVKPMTKSGQPDYVVADLALADWLDTPAGSIKGLFLDVDDNAGQLRTVSVDLPTLSTLPVGSEITWRTPSTAAVMASRMGVKM